LSGNEAATAGETPVTGRIASALSRNMSTAPRCGRSFMIYVRHAAAAIAVGLGETVLITHGESSRSGIGRTRNVIAPTSLAGQSSSSMDRWACAT
jgi:hypothetical protein